MTSKLRELFLWLIRLIVVWVVDAISLLVMVNWLPGLSIQAGENSSTWIVAAAAALVLGLVNLIIRPIILLLALPFGFFVILAVGFLINGIVLIFTSRLIPAFQIDSLLSALIGGFVFAVINTIITNLITIDDDDSFFQNIVERRASRQKIFADSSGPTQGVIMIEIDGLSYHHMQKALADGIMPTVSAMISEGGYKLHRIETGVPSMTSSCQAGILYGDNHDIPSFRWFDRDLNRFIVSQLDATMLDQRYSHGQGLVRGGSSIGNMLNGDAFKSMFVIATLRTAPAEENKQRASDIYLMLLDPYFFIRTIVLFWGDVILEVAQYFRQVMRKVEPRLNRLHNGYPLMRAALTSFLKDVSAYLIILDILRGTPALYHTYAGYDEMAHHAGPWTSDAFRELRRLDKVIARLLQVMADKAPRPYELILLSDHGQSFGHTFLMRYGLTLHDFIQQNLPGDAQVSATHGSDDGSTGVISMMNELDNIQNQSVGGSAGRSVLRGANSLLKQGVDQRVSEAPTKPADVKVAFSGNLANVYFTNFDHRVRISELNSAYPGLVDALIQHEGVGFLVGLNDEDEPVCFGKKGARNLHTGAVIGEDPLTPFADERATVDERAGQIARLADFPHAGDLIINSPVYADGTVAAYEELIGNHGGMGGEQTDAFILGPEDMDVPTTQNSFEVFGILNQRRGLIPQPKPIVATSKVNPWAFSTLWKGLTKIGVWFPRATRALIFDRGAYQEIAEDPYMTGPALLIGILFSLLPIWTIGWNLQDTLIRLAAILVTSVMFWLAGRPLRSKTDEFTPVFRTALFAQVSFLWLLIALVPQAAPLAQLLASLALILNMWIGGAVALKLKGWKTILLPVVASFILVFLVVALKTLAMGAQLTIQTLMTSFGAR